MLYLCARCIASVFVSLFLRVVWEYEMFILIEKIYFSIEKQKLESEKKLEAILPQPRRGISGFVAHSFTDKINALHLLWISSRAFARITEIAHPFGSLYDFRINVTVFFSVHIVILPKLNAVCTWLAYFV